MGPSSYFGAGLIRLAVAARIPKNTPRSTMAATNVAPLSMCMNLDDLETPPCKVCRNDLLNTYRDIPTECLSLYPP